MPPTLSVPTPLARISPATNVANSSSPGASMVTVPPDPETVALAEITLPSTIAISASAPLAS